MANLSQLHFFWKINYYSFEFQVVELHLQKLPTNQEFSELQIDLKIQNEKYDKLRTQLQNQKLQVEAKSSQCSTQAKEINRLKLKVTFCTQVCNISFPCNKHNESLLSLKIFARNANIIQKVKIFAARY